MTVGEIKKGLDKWPDDVEVTVMAGDGELEKLNVIAVNAPSPRVVCPVIWAAVDGRRGVK